MVFLSIRGRVHKASVCADIDGLRLVIFSNAISMLPPGTAGRVNFRVIAVIGLFLTCDVVVTLA